MSSTFQVINIEDNIDTARLIKLVLKELPIEIHHAADGKTALEMIKQFTPALLIVDVSLPDMHGWEVLDHMKTNGVDPQNIPVIMLTSHTEASHRVIAKLKSVASYMNKPFEPDDLRKLVRLLLKIE